MSEAKKVEPIKFSRGMKEVVDELREKYGPDALVFGSALRRIERIPTGLPALDKILLGGWPKGRIVEVWGPKSVGKSTLMAYTVRRLLEDKPGAKILYVDAENTLDPDWCRAIGVNLDLDRMFVARPMAAEDVGRLILKAIRDGWDLVIVDSVVEMLPMKELEREPEEESYAVLARFLARFLPKVIVLQSMSPTTIILVNQVRERVGFFLGDPQKSPGGRALEHLASLKLRVARGKTIEAKSRKGAKRRKVGFQIACRVVKSKVSKEGEECFLNFVIGEGIEGASP